MDGNIKSTPEKFIKIPDSLNPSPLDNKYRIQDEAYESVRNIILAHSKRVRSLNGNDPYVHEHSSIFITGGRGSGKTTFLLSIGKLVKELGVEVNAYFLDLIDPTLMHDSDNFVSIILGKINEAVCCECGDSALRNAFTKSLLDVAGIVEAITKSKTSEGLDNILDEQNALRLESEIRTLLKRACECLKCKFLILPIDDVDMAFKHGFNVLEKIRKYFATPLMLPIISGDFHLYEHIFSGKFYKQLAKGIKGNIGLFESRSAWFQDEAKFVDKSLGLANAYLAKVLPTDRRINLIEVGDICNRADVELELNTSSAENVSEGKAPIQIPVRDAIDKIKRKFNLGTGKYCVDNLNPFPRENLRDFIQFIAVIEKFLKDGALPDAGDSDSENFNYANYKQFFKKIADFYKYTEDEDLQKIRDFALANSRAIVFPEKEDGQKECYLSIKEFAKYENVLYPLFNQWSKEEHLIPYFPLGDTKFSSPENDLEKLFYIITFVGEIPNGARIFISPDRFFLWLTAKLFSNSDFDDKFKKEIYSVSFTDSIFNYDKVNEKEFYSDDDLDTSKSDPIKSYENIKLASNLDIDIRNGFLSSLRCSSTLIYSVYHKYRQNVNDILEEIRRNENKKDENDNIKSEPFCDFVRRLVYAYVNALAISTIENGRFSKNSICVKHANEKILHEKDLAYRWNIKSWNESDKLLKESVEISKESETKQVQESKEDNLMLKLFESLKNFTKGYSGQRDNSDDYYLAKNIKVTKTSSIVRKNGISIVPVSDLTPQQYKQRITSKIKSFIEKEHLSGSELIDRINKSLNYEELKQYDANKSWLNSKKDKLGDEVYNATFGRHFK